MVWLSLVFTFITFVFETQCLAERLTPAQVYLRCHSQLVRRRPLVDDPLLGAVKSGKISAPKACLKILESAELLTNGKVNSKQATGLEVLRTFQFFHMSWFPNHDLMSHEADFPTASIYDMNEMSYHLTWALLRPNEKYRSVMTSSRSFRAIRNSVQPMKFMVDAYGHGEFAKVDSKNWLQGSDEKKTSFKPNLIASGELIGIEPLPKNLNVVERPVKNKWTRFDLNQNLGAGMLGTPTYLMLSSSLKTKTLPDGGLQVHRGWSKALFRDLLCRELPVVQKEDGLPFIEIQSQLPFRRGKTCMQCHSTMDPMASVLRNVEFSHTGPHDVNFFVPRAVLVHAVENANSEYSRSPPSGKLFFRNYKGELISKEVMGISQLGEVLAGLDDPYICAAKRYFDFFTGIDVEIKDFSTEGPENRHSTLMKYRDFVIKQGVELKSHQNLKKVVENIFNSEFYQSKDFGLSR